MSNIPTNTTSSSSSRQGRIGANILFLGSSLLILSLVKIYQAQHCTIPLPHSTSPSVYDIPTSNAGVAAGVSSLASSADSVYNPDDPPADGPDDIKDDAEQEPPDDEDESSRSTAEAEEEEAVAVVNITTASLPAATISKSSRKAKSATSIATTASKFVNKHFVVQRKKTVPTPKTKVKDKNCECTLQTPAVHAKTLARVLVFQRDGRHQLRDFVTHYSRVLPYDSIVILDHRGEDEYTKSLLEDYGQRGVHIWSCNGPFHSKPAMWTYVTKVYGRDSGFVFPVDIDELLAVRVGSELQWNIPAFRSALKPLTKSGKPFKMNWIESVPAECHVYMPQFQQQKREELEKRKLSSTSSQQQDLQDTGIYTSEMCDIQYVKIKDVGCMDKTFSRGTQFYKTDTGNHYGGTRKFRNLTKKMCEEQGIETIYELTNFALVHLKEKTFEDWLIHGLRGATDRGFNKNFNIDCDEVSQSLHYCHKWAKLTQAKFSPYILRKIYIEDVCPAPEVKLMPAHKVFCDE